MEFWGIAVKPGESVKVDPGEDTYLHLSQTSLGETKKDKLSESVAAFVTVDDKKLVIGTLSGEKCPQISHDLVFNDELELSHSSKSTTLYFLGYKAQADGEEPGSSDTDSETDNEAIKLAEKANGKPDLTEGIKAAKLLSGQGEGSSKKSKVKAEDSKAGKSKQVADDDDSDSDEEDSDEDESDSGDEDMHAALDDSDDEDEVDSSDEEDEATPKKVEVEATPKKAENSKKRAADSATKTPVPEKKAKLVSPSGSQKTGGGKKSVHTATPYPTKQAAKTPANTDKSKPKTPKSGGSGSIACKSCSKTFNSDGALQSHTKAKHEAK